MVEYTDLGKNSRKILERLTPYGSMKIWECVSLKLIVKAKVVIDSMFTILLILARG